MTVRRGRELRAPQTLLRVIELVGTTTPSFRPLDHIPTAVRLTSYAGEAGDISREELQRYVTMVVVVR